jgi:hypothetical protein
MLKAQIRLAISDRENALRILTRDDPPVDSEMQLHHDRAVERALLTAVTIMQAALKANVSNDRIAAFVELDFCRSVDAYMLSNFGNCRQPGRLQELKALRDRTHTAARHLPDRLRVLAHEATERRPTMRERVVRRVQNELAIVIVVLIMSAVTSLAKPVEVLLKLIGH